MQRAFFVLACQLKGRGQFMNKVWIVINLDWEEEDVLSVHSSREGAEVYARDWNDDGLLRDGIEDSGACVVMYELKN